jgi:regulator of protease activity HflC (stomatin/prohibitin superfamily)
MDTVTSVLLALGIVVVGFWLFTRFVRIVPEQQSHLVEQFGRFSRALGPGFHLIIPLVERVAYKQSLKEEAIDVDPQVCVTNDNVQVSVDGILYIKVVDAHKASYGIDSFRFATAQLAQTTMRSEIGRIDLDRSFSERESLNTAIVRSIDEASDPWGIKVTRYEIRDISPPATVLQAMEQQMRAEREKRAQILESEGEKTARINSSKGEREEAINLSRGERQRRINTAEGRAKAIEVTAVATADGIREIAGAIQLPKGRDAVAMRIAQQFVHQFGQILNHAKTSVMPIDVAQVRALLQTVLPRRAAEEVAVAARPTTTPGGDRRPEGS